MFLSKCEFDNSAGRASKIEKWSTLDTAFISIYVTSFGFEPFILHCFVSQSKTV